MLLLIDVGNTSNKLCLCDNTSLYKYGKVIIKKIKYKFSQIMSRYDIEDIIISSVVPMYNKIISESVNEAFGLNPIFINTSFVGNINICLENSDTLGVDRFINAVAIHSLYENENVIVIDFGTATTYDFIRKTGDFEFGLICPGIGTCLNALYEKTAQLPRVKFTSCKSIIATNTYSSILAGNYFSKVGEIEYIINRIKSELNEFNIKVVATGGYASIISQDIKHIDIINTNLIFEGMKILYLLNKSRSKNY